MSSPKVPVAARCRLEGRPEGRAVADQAPTQAEHENDYIAAAASSPAPPANEAWKAPGAAATIKDVARASGVSVATVSRALNGTAKVQATTRQRIDAAAAALRFSPSGAARSLITRRTDTLGALLPDLHGEYFSELIRGIDQAARARGLHLLLSSSHGHADEAAAALRAMAGRVDGLLVMSPHADGHFLHRNLPAGVPVVLLNAADANPAHLAYSVDNHGGAKRMTQHLAQAAARRRIAFICGPEGNLEARERARGYRDGLPQEQAPILFEGDFSEASGFAAGQRIVALQQRPDAVFAANDMMAIGCMAALAAAGLRVPEDIALAGFDDIPIARYVAPALTTVHVPIVELGALALAALAAQMDPHAVAAAPPHTRLEVELVIRRSCGTPAHAAAGALAPASTAPSKKPAPRRQP